MEVAQQCTASLVVSETKLRERERHCGVPAEVQMDQQPRPTREGRADYAQSARAEMSQERIESTVAGEPHAAAKLPRERVCDANRICMPIEGPDGISVGVGILHPVPVNLVAADDDINRVEPSWRQKHAADRAAGDSRRGIRLNATRWVEWRRRRKTDRHEVLTGKSTDIEP